MYYGRAGELRRLWQDEHNPNNTNKKRYAAMKTRQVILDQLEDKPLMALRERLIRAAQAGDEVEQARISLQMRDYLGQAKESGLIENSSYL